MTTLKEENIIDSYSILMETNGKEYESWYYFIRNNGNEEALDHLQKQLGQVNWYIRDELSTFDLDTDHPVSAETAKQMTKIELNAYSFHRKFDGKLQKINLGFSAKDKNKKKIEKTFDLFGYGQIEDYISDEDIDPEDLLEDLPESSEKNIGETSDSEESSSDDSSDESECEVKNRKKPKIIPSSLLKKMKM